VSIGLQGAGQQGMKRGSETNPVGQNRGAARRTLETPVQSRTKARGCSVVLTGR
jgi:hypothetical protein